MKTQLVSAFFMATTFVSLLPAHAVASEAIAEWTNLETQELVAKERALATSIGELLNSACESDAECKTVPYGARACRGLDSFLIYSNKSTDEGKLLPLVEKHASLQDELAKRLGVTSCSSNAAEVPPAKLVCRQNTCAAD